MSDFQKSMTFIPIEGPMPYTEMWYACRVLDRDRDPPVFFGASEAAALCGISDYQSAYELYLRKMGLIAADEDNEFKQFGRALEGVILTEYARREQVTMMGTCPMLIHPEHRYLSATPDTMAWRTRREDWFPVDAKNTNARRFKLQFGMEWSDEVPTDILMQAQQQMLVTGTTIQETAVLVGGNSLKVFRIERDDRLCNSIIDAGQEMERCVLSCRPPDPDFSHPGIVDVMKKAHKLNVEEVCWFGDEVNEWWTTYRALGEQVKELEAEQDQMKAQILHRMGEAATGRFVDGDIELVRQVRHRAGYEVKPTDYTVLIQKKVKK